MNNVKKNNLERKIGKTELEKLIIIAILFWIIFDIIGFLYFSLHLNILLYPFFIILAIIIIIFVYIIKNKHNISDK